MPKIKHFIFTLIFALVASPTFASEKRCGWLVNSTPGNYRLTDREAHWALSMQLGFEAKGLDKITDFPEKEFIAIRPETGYGYGCACLEVEVQPSLKRITNVLNFQPLPLKRCQQDRQLKPPF